MTRSPGDANGGRPPVLVWFRNDLRVDDHEPLTRALETGGDVIPVYCIDPRLFGKTSFGFPKTGPHRARFLTESLADLRATLRRLGSDLLLRRGLPEVELPRLAAELGARSIYFHAEVTREETDVERMLQDETERRGISSRSFWGATLYHRDDLPFAVEGLPELFTPFRRAVEKEGALRPTAPAPTGLPPLPAVAPGELPAPPDGEPPFGFRGGETAGRRRLDQYVWERDRLRVYKETRNGMLERDDSTRFSPWLALGCLSPRRVHAEVMRYEVERVRNESTHWLVFELLWRDYFRFVCAKHGDRLFLRSGIRGLRLPWSEDRALFRYWQDGTTGYPLVDANMRELRQTGYMSNRGRQNVASFLTKNLGIDWRIGAEWFESQLVDYDVCSNWGNWNYAAGVGNDARGFRVFNIARQARTYDADGRYVRHWLPELTALPADKVHEPWKLTADEQQRFGVSIGADYPEPVVDFDASIRRNRAAYDAGTAC